MSALPDSLKHVLSGYERIGNVTDEQQLYEGVRRIQKRGWVDRLEASIEAHILTTARVREATKIPGLSSESALLCRDKPLMKQFLREHGIATAASTDADSIDVIEAFAETHGFPLILKPRDAAGAAGTYRVDSLAEVQQVAAEMGLRPGRAVAVEEFVSGHEGFYDTLTVNGEIVHDFISHYYPNVLEAMRTRWISPQIVVTNRVDAPSYDELKVMGRDVVKHLGITTSATHMEWFFGPRGLRFSEIGARPPGVSHWDAYCAANDIDIYQEWAHAICYGSAQGQLSRRYAAGIIALRPSCDGVITGYTGVDALHARYGKYVIDVHLPSPGTPTQPVAAGYMANAWVRLRHPDYDTLREMLDDVGRTLKVHAQ